MSVARLALKHEINANLLRKCITEYLVERERDAPSTSQADCID
jgi:transposase-like protein